LPGVGRCHQPIHSRSRAHPCKPPGHRRRRRLLRTILRSAHQMRNDRSAAGLASKQRLLHRSRRLRLRQKRAARRMEGVLRAAVRKLPVGRRADAHLRPRTTPVVEDCRLERRRRGERPHVGVDVVRLYFLRLVRHTGQRGGRFTS